VAYFLTSGASGAFLKSVIGYSWRKVMTIGGNNYLYVARILDIIVYDHVIIGENRFFSFREEGLI